MKKAALQNNQRLLSLSLVIVPVLVAAAFWLASRRLQQEQLGALNLVKHTYLVREQLYNLRQSIQKADLDQVSYALTKDQTNLSSYLFATSNLNFQFEALKQLVADNKVQSARVAKLQNMVEARMKQTSGSIHLPNDGPGQESFQDVSDANHNASQIEQAIEEMLLQEGSLLRQRSTQNDSKLQLRENVSTFLLIFTAAVIVGAGALFRRVQKLQNIITVCAWTQRVNFKGRWMRMEEFLWERFRVKVSHGISEEAFDGVMGIVGKNLTISEKPAERGSISDSSAK